MKNSRVINLREMMIVVILSLLCGLLYMGWGPVWGIADAVHPAAGEAIYGIWFIAATLTAYIIRKPGVALIAEMAAASVEAAMGGQWGVGTLAYGFAQGVGVELIFAIFGYRRWNVPVMMFAGILAAAGSFVISAIYGDLDEYTTGVLVTSIIVRVISGAIITGLVAKWIGDLLAKTGVLNSYRIVRDKAENPF